MSETSQWIGEIKNGTNNGYCLLNFEQRVENKCKVMFYDYSLLGVSLWADLQYIVDGSKFEGQLSDFWFFDKTLCILQKSEILNFSQRNKEFRLKSKLIQEKMDQEVIVDTLLKKGWLFEMAYGEYKLTKTFLSEINEFSNIFKENAEKLLTIIGENFYILPASGTASGELKEGTLQFNYKTDVGTNGTGAVSITGNTNFIDPDYKFNSWEEFKSNVGNIIKPTDFNKWIFRGHNSNKYHLKTTFHRAGRTDILSYKEIDIEELLYFVNSVSAYKFDFNKSRDLDTLLFLSQHHGFPTPLLDWSDSIYVAIYFAYQRFTQHSDDDYVRIYCFDYATWGNLWSQYAPKANVLVAPIPMISCHRPPIINNDRAIPQQSVSMFSNILDIESFIDSFKSRNNGVSPLIKIDLPYRDKKTVIKELYKMGITYGALFPGLDGICKHLKEKNFEII